MRTLLLFVLSILFLGTDAYGADELVVYTARKEHLIKPLFDAYKQETGVKISFSTDSAGALLQKIKAEGKQTPADVLITVDAGNLWHAAEEGLLAAINSETLSKNIPAHLRDSQNRWFGLSVRSRTIVYSTERVDPANLSTYEALGETQWNQRLCLRTSKKVYNQSLVAMMIAELGPEQTENVVRSWVNNLATDVFSNDTAVMEAIEAGQCDVGIVNTYYFGRLQKKNPDLPLALFWPNQAENQSGVHVNISGAGVVKHSKNQEAAIRFIEWLSSGEAQKVFAAENLEFPANPDTASDPLVASWGEFKQNLINVSKAGALQGEAVKLMDRAGYK